MAALVLNGEQQMLKDAAKRDRRVPRRMSIKGLHAKDGFIALLKKSRRAFKHDRRCVAC